ncbi:MAG TPA: ribbon-helix-helix domain-containing protein [Steroidobacteraceae bacterium]
MPRTIVDIPAAQMRELDARCRVLGVSRAEGVRRAVHAFLNVKYGLEEEGFGLWTRGGTESPTARGRPPKGKAP